MNESEKQLAASFNRLTRDADTVALVGKVATALRVSGHEAEGDELFDLLGAAEKSFNNPATAPQDAQVNGVLRECHALLPDGDMKLKFGTLVRETLVPQPAMLKIG